MQSNKLVIDASIARASGPPESTHPTGQQCRECLETVRTAGHQMVMTPEIKAEWDRHQSGFARKWRVRMVGGKKVVSLKAVSYEEVASQFEGVVASPKEHQAMKKDWPLVGAALTADKTIISLDEAVRRLFKKSASTVQALRRLVWVNPTIPEEEAIKWLKHGAKPERPRMLAAGT